MHSIKKLSNNKIKEIKKLHQKKYRDEKGLFIVEGQKALEEIINSKTEIIEIFALKPNINNSESQFTAGSSQNITYISEDEMKKISTTSSVCEILTIAKKKTYLIQQIADGNNLILLDSVSDPGNLGTIIRSSAAFNTDGIILYGNCTELYSPKVIRSATGNFFKTPIININNIKDLKKYFPEHKLIATALQKADTISFKEAALINKKIIMFGSEANGLSKELTEISDENILINMKSDVESLNLSVSASIILYELYNNNININ